MKHIFSARLHAQRIQAGISQKELAVTISVTPASLSNYENGINLPTLPKACLLAKQLNTSLDYLTGLSDVSTIINANPNSAYTKTPKVYLVAEQNDFDLPHS